MQEQRETGSDAVRPRSGVAGAGAAETALFLLAHQDDEIMVAPLISAEKLSGRAVSIVYLTNGDGGGPTGRRNAESTRYLASLGVDPRREVLFLGTARGISDGTLYRDLAGTHDAILEQARKLPRVVSVYVHAWEGGNPDHDAGHALGLGVAHALGCADAVRQVPFYRAPSRGPLPFVLYAPLPENGPVAYHRLGFAARLRRLLAVRHFPSQARTFVRFLPLMLLDAVLNPGIAMQLTAPERLFERPMRESLRYERIGYVRFADMAPHVTSYWNSVVSAGQEHAADAPATASGEVVWMQG